MLHHVALWGAVWIAGATVVSSLAASFVGETLEWEDRATGFVSRLVTFFAFYGCVNLGNECAWYACSQRTTGSVYSCRVTRASIFCYSLQFCTYYYFWRVMFCKCSILLSLMLSRYLR